MPRKRHVIIIEDDPSVSDMLCDFFDDRGYRITLFDTLSDFRSGMDNGSADIMIIDNQLPDGKGVEALEEFCKTHPDVSPRSIALMSGVFSGGEEDKAKQVGCAILRKPFNLNDLEDWLEKTG